MVIKGPSSALSSFLKEKGINVPRYNAYGRAAEGQEPIAEEPAVEGAPVEQVNQDEEITVQVTIPLKKKKGEKKRVLEESESELKAIAPRAKHTKKKLVIDSNHSLCSKCNRRIQLSSIPTLLCSACSSIPKQKRSQKPILLSERALAPTLQQICLMLISQHISSIEDFGDVSSSVKESIMRILCRRRQLNETNMMLFLGPDEEQLEFSDCTLIGENGFKLISSFCVNIKSLSLSLCGKINDDAMVDFSTSLLNVIKLKLGGCFLVSDKGLSLYLSSIASQLTNLTLIEGQKLTIESFRPIFQHNTLKSLTLKRCPNVCGELLAELGKCKSLKKLKLISVGNNIEDEMYVELFKAVGSHLSVLSLSGQTIGDKVLVEGIAPYCNHLTELSLKSLSEVTPLAITELFSKLDLVRIEKINLRRLVQTTDNALVHIIKRSFSTLRKLNMNGLDDLTADFFDQMLKFSFDSLELLDVSFVRSFSDVCLVELLKCKSLKCVKVYGAHRLTELILNGVWKNQQGERIKLQGNEFD